MHPGRARRINPDLVIDPNRPISNREANRLLKKYGRRCGIDREKCHIHGLRHAGARLRREQMQASGTPVDYDAIKTLLGHSSLAVTEIYVHRVLQDPEDPGAADAARALMPTRRRPSKPLPPEQDTFL
jgi:integrase